MVVTTIAWAVAEKPEEPSVTDLGVGLMLMGSVGFMMSIFYLVNHSDPEFRCNAWIVVCMTISIFTAVLIFQAANGLVEHYFLEDASDTTKCVFGLLHALGWYITLQIFLAVVSGAVSCPTLCYKHKIQLAEEHIKAIAREQGNDLKPEQIAGFAKQELTPVGKLVAKCNGKFDKSWANIFDKRSGRVLEDNEAQQQGAKKGWIDAQRKGVKPGWILAKVDGSPFGSTTKVEGARKLVFVEFHVFKGVTGIGISEEHKGKIEEIKPGGQAERHRIQRGRYIVEVDGETYQEELWKKKEKSENPYLLTFMSDSVELNMRCWAVLLGHTTGFASIGLFAQIQHVGFQPGSYLEGWRMSQAWSMVLLACGALYLLSQMTNFIRDRVSKADDGFEDPYEDMWDDFTQETEDDVMGLTLSFLVVQCVRGMIVAGSSALPNVEGEMDLTELHPTWLQADLLMIVGFVFSFLSVLLKPKRGRVTRSATIASDFIFSWCLLFGVETRLAASNLFKEEESGMVLLAIIISVLSFVGIWLLDQIADTKMLGDTVSKHIRSKIVALGILIGFSWEKCFDIAVSNVATVVEDELKYPAAVTKMFLALLLAGIVVPAWRWFILPTVQELGGFEEGEEAENEEVHESPKPSKPHALRHPRRCSQELDQPLLQDIVERLEQLEKEREEEVRKHEDANRRLKKLVADFRAAPLNP